MTWPSAAGPVVMQAMVWQRAEGTWRRHLVRKLRDGTTTWTEIHYVPFDVPVCLACLSTEVVIEPSDRYEDGVLRCFVCGASYGIL